QANIISYGVEWGYSDRSNDDPFHPGYDEMAEIIQEVTSGLLAFCLEVADPCWRPRNQVEALTGQIDDLEEVLRELPPPERPPTRIAAIERQIAEKRRELFAAEQQLQECRRSNP